MNFNVISSEDLTSSAFEGKVSVTYGCFSKLVKALSLLAPCPHCDTYISGDKTCIPVPESCGMYRLVPVYFTGSETN